MNKLYTNNIVSEELIGRAKTILVSKEGPAIITSIIVRPIRFSESTRLVFTGLVRFEEKLKRHIANILLPHIDEILQKIELPLQSYDISAQNIGAVSSNDSEFTLEGYSADIPIFLAIISSSLRLPIKQNTVFTGHICSKEGDISQVKSLVEKSVAAQREEYIIEFVYPSLDKDSSLKVLKPKEYEKTVSAIRACRGMIKLVEIDNTSELITKTLTDESMVTGSLTCGFFEKKLTETNNSNLDSIVNYLLARNKERFWSSLENSLLSKRVEHGKKLLNKYLQFYLMNKKYPKNLGLDLTNLILSLPFSSKKADGLFPLMPKDQYIKLIQYANESDYEDISYLHDAVYDRIKTDKITHGIKNTKQIKNNISSEIIDYILEKLNPNHIDIKISKPIDEARSTYVFDKINVDSYDELIESITKFYIHIIRHTNSESVKPDREKYTIEALDLMKKIYPQKTDYNSAISNGINGYNGGMRVIFDMVTEYLKRSEKNRYIFAAINENINPNNYGLKKSLVEEIIKRESSNLNIDKSLLMPEKYVENYIEIIKKYIESKRSLNKIFEKF